MIMRPTPVKLEEFSRSANAKQVQNCGTCRFSRYRDFGNQQLIEECRKRSPVLMEMRPLSGTAEHNIDRIIARWPQIKSTDWCGDWEMDT